MSVGGLCAASLPITIALVIGVCASAIDNWMFVWLMLAEPASTVLYVDSVVDQFGHGLAGAVFIVYLSILVSQRYPGAQYAFLSRFAFLLPHRIGGASGAIQKQIDYDGFFILSGALSLATILLSPVIARPRPRMAAIEPAP